MKGTIQSEQDRLLLIQISEGDATAFDMVYEKYWDKVIDEAYKRLSDRDLAKDVAQEVFTSLWTRNKEIQIENLPAWLHTVTKNNVFKLMQREERFVPLPDLLSELGSYNDRADAAIVEKELNRSHDAVVASLPDQQRIVFKMRYNDELTPQEIASRLDVSQKTVRNHLGRALMKLKATIFVIQLLILFSL
jgi:RNA polymerase sigma-70 factor (family 1)